jgi:alkylation response protein AidB-like acyl-CoA dehydrogenase
MTETLANEALHRHDGGEARRTALSPEAIKQAIAGVAEGAERRDREDLRPFDAVDIVRRARLGALRVPRELGGGGASLRDLFTTLIDLAEADSNVAHLLRNHYAFVEGILIRADSPQGRAWLPHIVDGDIFSNAGGELVALPVASEQWYNFRTAVTAEGDGFVINGAKYYTTGALFSDWLTVLATQEGVGIVSATLPTRREGIRIIDDWDGIGQRSTASGTLLLENVHVGARELVSGTEYFGPNYLTTLSQLWLHAVIAGELRNARGSAVGLLRKTRGFGHAPTTEPTQDPLLQQTIGQIASAAYAAEVLVLDAAAALDAVHASLVEGVPDADVLREAQLRSAMVKVHIDSIALQAASAVFDVGGGSAATRKARLDRHWRNIRTLVSHNPAAYKAQGVGAYLVNGTPLSANGYY